MIALGSQAARVLVGRDISSRGMRVDHTEALSLGQELRIAIHVPARETPLVVEGRVDRDDGARGLVLRFAELSAGVRACLDEMLGELPLAASAGAADFDRPSVVSEILEANG